MVAGGPLTCVRRARSNGWAELDEAHRHLRAAERSLRLWEGTAWAASLTETRGHVAHAERRDADAQRLFIDAAARFEAAGQPLDTQRCRVRPTQPDDGADALSPSASGGLVGFADDDHDRAQPLLGFDPAVGGDRLRHRVDPVDN